MMEGMMHCRPPGGERESSQLLQNGDTATRGDSFSPQSLSVRRYPSLLPSQDTPDANVSLLSPESLMTPATPSSPTGYPSVSSSRDTSSSTLLPSSAPSPSKSSSLLDGSLSVQTPTESTGRSSLSLSSESPSSGSLSLPAARPSPEALPWQESHEKDGFDPTASCNFFSPLFPPGCPYTPIALLGTGAVARVFQCLDQRRNPPTFVAVKLIRKQILKRNPVLRQQVINEKEALRRLSVPRPRSGGDGVLASSAPPSSSSSSGPSRSATVEVRAPESLPSAEADREGPRGGEADGDAERGSQSRRFCPFIPRLLHAFQDAQRLFLVMDLSGFSNLQEILRRVRPAHADFEFSPSCPIQLSEQAAKTWTAELVAALEWLRERGVVHRDLKPQNLVISPEGHLCVVDFGAALLLPADDQTRQESRERPEKKHEVKPGLGLGSGAGGSRSTLSPLSSSSSLGVSSGLLNGAEGVVRAHQETQTHAQKPSSSSCASSSSVPSIYHALDLWSLGCIAYEMLCGRPAFEAQVPQETVEKILRGAVEFPSSLSAEARDFISRLLVVDPTERLGFRDFSELKFHPFLASLGEDLWRLPSVPLVRLYERKRMRTLRDAEKANTREAKREADALQEPTASNAGLGSNGDASRDTDDFRRSGDEEKEDSGAQVPHEGLSEGDASSQLSLVFSQKKAMSTSRTQAGFSSASAAPAPQLEALTGNAKLLGDLPSHASFSELQEDAHDPGFGRPAAQLRGRCSEFLPSIPTLYTTDEEGNGDIEASLELTPFLGFGASSLRRAAAGQAPAAPLPVPRLAQAAFLASPRAEETHAESDRRDVECAGPPPTAWRHAGRHTQFFPEGSLVRESDRQEGGSGKGRREAHRRPRAKRGGREQEEEATGRKASEERGRRARTRKEGREEELRGVVCKGRRDISSVDRSVRQVRDEGEDFDGGGVRKETARETRTRRRSDENIENRMHAARSESRGKGEKEAGSPTGSRDRASYSWKAEEDRRVSLARKEHERDKWRHSEEDLGLVQRREDRSREDNAGSSSLSDTAALSLVSDISPLGVLRAFLDERETAVLWGPLTRMQEETAPFKRFCSIHMRRRGYRLYGNSRAALQPEPCLAVLTDKPRLLLFDPFKLRLRKSILLSGEGLAVSAEGGDVLFYQSSRYSLLFMDDRGQAEVWAEIMSRLILLRGRCPSEMPHIRHFFSCCSHCFSWPSRRRRRASSVASFGREESEAVTPPRECAEASTEERERFIRGEDRHFEEEAVGMGQKREDQRRLSPLSLSAQRSDSQKEREEQLHVAEEPERWQGYADASGKQEDEKGRGQENPLPRLSHRYPSDDSQEARERRASWLLKRRCSSMERSTTAWGDEEQLAEEWEPFSDDGEGASGFEEESEDGKRRQEIKNGTQVFWGDSDVSPKTSSFSQFLLGRAKKVGNVAAGAVRAFHRKWRSDSDSEFRAR
ncbi:UNVERIFIED_CONTAM: protein kinase domain-containing protein [Hammondia hammondi]|eukprot:XP_008883280.1 protein kinase domain-containing protein [Hammondia hammondi]